MDTIFTCIIDVKAFLKENPKEEIACAAQIFQLPEKTLYNSITRSKKPLKKQADIIEHLKNIK